MIAIIDYGMGNLRSMQKAIEALGFTSLITSKRNKIEDAAKVIFPGVGAFGSAVENLKRLKLFDFIRDLLGSGKPFLGVCLGLQLLFEKSEESRGVEGLGVFKGKVIRFPANKLKVPHMGWNTIEVVRRPSTSPSILRSSGSKDSGSRAKSRDSSFVVRSKLRSTIHDSRSTIPAALFNGILNNSFMYFVHSYYVVPEDKSIVVATTKYGITFASAIVKDNIFGVQFHPEKSANNGLKILKNFCQQ